MKDTQTGKRQVLPACSSSRTGTANCLPRILEVSKKYIDKIFYRATVLLRYVQEVLSNIYGEIL